MSASPRFPGRRLTADLVGVALALSLPADMRSVVLAALDAYMADDETE